MNERIFYVYILASKRNGTLYVGMTNDLQRRMYEHQNGLVEGFTKKYAVKNLVYYDVYPTAEEAIAQEKRLKEWQRKWKIRIIEERNPNWDDLSLNLNA